jgi:hypothetical protein
MFRKEAIWIRPIIITNKKHTIYLLIDVAIPSDRNVIRSPKRN